MFDSLYQMQDISIFLILAGVTTAFSLVTVLLAKRYIFFRLRYRDNATIASISSLIGIIYGVLVGFIALYLIDNNDRASDAVLREANAIANIYRDSQWLKEPTQKLIGSRLEDYSNIAIHQEWPKMRLGKEIGSDADRLIQDLSVILKNYTPSPGSETLVMQNLITEVNTLYNARQERISMSGAQLSPELWEVILVGTILIIGINYAFRVNFYLHLFGISAFAIMAASMLFLLVTLDRPFQGEFIIEPQPFQEVLDFMKQADATQSKVARLKQAKHLSYRHIHSFHRALASDLSE